MTWCLYSILQKWSLGLLDTMRGCCEKRLIEVFVEVVLQIWHWYFTAFLKPWHPSHDNMMKWQILHLLKPNPSWHFMSSCNDQNKLPWIIIRITTQIVLTPENEPLLTWDNHLQYQLTFLPHKQNTALTQSLPLTFKYYYAFSTMLS